MLVPSFELTKACRSLVSSKILLTGPKGVGLATTVKITAIKAGQKREHYFWLQFN